MMNSDYDPQRPTAPMLQPEYVIDVETLATIEQVSNLKRWVIISFVGNFIFSSVISGLLVFVYYSLLIEIQ